MSGLEAAIGLQAVGTLFSTISGIQQARAQADSDEATGKQAMEAAKLDEQADRRRSAQIIAKQQAGAAASGLDIDSGTPLELLMDSTFNAELNALKIRKQGEYDRAFYKNRARGTRAQIPGIAFQGLTSLGAQGANYASGGGARQPLNRYGSYGRFGGFKGP